MISRRFSAWQKVVALAPLFLLAAYLPGEMMLRCRIDGRLRPACCCPQDAERESGPAIEAQDCCDREVTAGVRPVVDAVQPADRGLIAAAALLPFAAPALLSLAPPPRPLASAAARYGPAREGPPIVLLKHAFLI